MKAKILILLFMLFACASQRKVVQEGDALVLLTDLTKESKAKNFELSQQKVAEIVAEMDSLCENEIIVSPIYDIVKLEKQVDKISQLDHLLLNHAEKTNNNRLAIAVREFKFRALVKTQQRMDEFFENETIVETEKTHDDTLGQKEKEEFSPGEVHGRWVFKERVSMMLPYMQANQRFSREKTALLYESVDLLSQIEDKQEKRRCWLAIDRMLDQINVQKSEAGYRPFQRGPYGIYTRPGEIIEKLRSQHARETDEDIRAFSAIVVDKLEKNLNAVRKGSFWDKVEFSRALNKKLETEGFNLQRSSEELNEPSLEGLTASEWFDKGYAEPDENLKIEYYSKAIELNTQYAAAYNNRGDAYQASGKENEAFQDFSKAVQFNPEFAPAYINRGNIYQNRGKHEEAIQDFSRAIELEPKYTLAYNNRGTSYKNLDRYEEALQDFDKAIQLEPKFISAYFNRGDVYRKMGQDQQAIADHTKAIELDPNNAVAHNNRGLSYNNLGEYQKAIQDYRKAIEILPDYAAAYYNIGVVYWTLKRWKDVVKVWEKSLELNPDQNYIIQYLPRAKRQARKMR
ncbi:MAG: tetratricopeptide repeat protein [bacterium]|nr:MAG: tetratricopeptide repeat protein [bacterium]